MGYLRRRWWWWWWWLWWWSNQHAGQPKLNYESDLDNATRTICGQVRTRLDVLSPLAIKANEGYLRGCCCGGGGGGGGLWSTVASKSANAPLSASEPCRDQMRPPSCYARCAAMISTAGVCCDWEDGDGQGVDIRTSCVVGCCRGQAAKLTSVIIYLPPTARGGARAHSRTTISGKQVPCMRSELAERVEDGLNVDYEVGVILICLAFYSLISEVRSETTFSTNTTTAFRTSNASQHDDLQLRSTIQKFWH
jgi:hypothetical protein